MPFQAAMSGIHGDHAAGLRQATVIAKDSPYLRGLKRSGRDPRVGPGGRTLMWARPAGDASCVGTGRTNFGIVCLLTRLGWRERRRRLAATHAIRPGACDPHQAAAPLRHGQGGDVFQREAVWRFRDCFVPFKRQESLAMTVVPADTMKSLAMTWACSPSPSLRGRRRIPADEAVWRLRDCFGPFKRRVPRNDDGPRDESFAMTWVPTFTTVVRND